MRGPQFQIMNTLVIKELHANVAGNEIIRTLRDRGYRFVTVPELLGFRTVYRKCVRDCEDAAITGRPPAGSIIEPR